MGDEQGAAVEVAQLPGGQDETLNRREGNGGIGHHPDLTHRG
jgi:hypothetical protein